jgi:hypothetical protein
MLRKAIALDAVLLLDDRLLTPGWQRRHADTWQRHRAERRVTLPGSTTACRGGGGRRARLTPTDKLALALGLWYQRARVKPKVRRRL